MKCKRLVPVILFAALCGWVSYGYTKTGNATKASPATQEPFVKPCDSLYGNDFVRHKDLIADTLINGVEYVFVLPLWEKYELAFREFSEEYRMLKCIDLLNNGNTTGAFEDDKADEPDLYYGDLKPSPSKKYVLYCRYYATWTLGLFIEGIEEEVVRFSGGYILDLMQNKVTTYLGPSDLDGNWNYCDQWVVDGEVVFDPTRREE